MRIQAIQNLANSNYQVALTIIEHENSEYINAVHDYGEDAINIGGAILDNDNSTVLATLPIINIKITDLTVNPYVQDFLVCKYKENTQKVAELWAKQSANKIYAYIDIMQKKIDNFSGIVVFDKT